MDISKLGSVDVKASYDSESLESLIAKAHAGNAILFLGAGFSKGSVCESGKELPLAGQLSIEICKLGKFEEDEDLAYSADYYLKYNDPAKLVGMLRGRFHVTEVSDFHKSIASVNWRRVYTTNYDNAYELAAGCSEKVVSPITLDHNPGNYFRNRDICIHINGAIQTLNSESLETIFKLSESSYTNSDAFSDSSWSYRFKKDIELCSQIVFVGYSLYDMEVKRLLVNNDLIKKKTFFIASPDISTKSHHRLSSFGEVFPIGVENFGNLLSKNKPDSYPKELSYMSSFKKEDISYDAKYSGSQIRDFLLRGKCSLNHISYSLTSDSSPYAVEREQVGEALNILKKKNVVILHGSLANGKSVVLDQIASNLIMEGKNVFSVKDREAGYESDIEKIAESNQISYLIIDDFESSTDIVRYYSSCLGDNGKLILSERPNGYKKAVATLSDLGIGTYNINVDYLHKSELESLDEIISNTGLWGKYAGLSKEARIRRLEKECESQLSVTLMNILKSPDVISRFSSAFSNILKHPDTKKTVHAICLIQHICPSECNKSFISDISDSSHVYSREFEERINESNIFEVKGSELTTRSSIFGTFLLNSLYKSSYSIDQLVRVVEKLNKNRSTQTKEESEMYRGIMKFGTISAILPDDDKPGSYIEFYEKLKDKVPNVIGNPHFWLQYAMAVMSTNNLSDAEIILDTAYAKANNNPEYDTTYIDNQYARLNLKKAISEPQSKLCYELFEKAHNILKREESDIHKFRQAGLYITFYQSRFSTLPKRDKVNFEHAIKHIIRQYEGFLAYEYPTGDVPPFHIENIESFRDVLKDIASSRISA
ncbi:SIR2 family protein [Teredinibacter turnerae]|uniref:P-loop NTPase n=1 Tax=Teredinibacter turnerae TaxID=2426 RepID=UPI0003683661|nr:SIR2 family protein [Teredinibacter turnerae]